MRNLVKKAKSQMWMAYAGGILSGVLFCVLTYWITNLNSSLLHSKIDVALFCSTVFMLAMTGLLVGFAIYFIIRDKIWDKAKKFKEFVRNYRTTHIANMVEKAINSNNKEKAMILVDQYNTCKNKNKALLNYLDGIIEGKFSDIIDLELNEVKFEEHDNDK